MSSPKFRIGTILLCEHQSHRAFGVVIGIDAVSYTISWPHYGIKKHPTDIMDRIYGENGENDKDFHVVII